MKLEVGMFVRSTSTYSGSTAVKYLTAHSRVHRIVGTIWYTVGGGSTEYLIATRLPSTEPE